jgi:hypothetical protein
VQLRCTQSSDECSNVALPLLSTPPNDHFSNNDSEKRDLSGEDLEQALWLGAMELKRLEAWVPAQQDVDADRDIGVKL